MSKQDDIDRAAQESLRLLGADPANWVLPTPGVDHDVAVIGGGQSGVTIAFALRRAGVSDVTVLEAADRANTGVWRTRARMNTLRTPKTRSGPELGNPALGFQSWYEGLYGQAAFQAIGRIARTDWADYLDWFQGQVGVEVRYGTRVVDVEPADGLLRLHLVTDGQPHTEVVRKLVFANGVEGTGGPSIPAIFEALPEHLYAHTGDEIDFAALNGKKVGVLGAATSALDAAAVALESGADEVHVFSYRAELVIQPTGGNVPNPGAQENFHLQPDAVRWKSRWAQASKGSTSPLDTVLRAVAFPNLRLHFNAPWVSLREEDGRVVVEAADGTHTYDFVIAGTGYQYDPRTRPELRRLAEDVALWRDVYDPPADLRSEALGAFPYLGKGYELTERVPGSAPWLRDIHLFNAAASHSFGRPVGDIPSLRTGVPRLVEAIGHDLFFADQGRPKPTAAAAGESFVEHYAHAVWRSSAEDAEDAEGVGVEATVG
ncbi:NAD(P)/FAD-dependent oxidoreductase [Streptosporangium saharense]|uniref:NAD(P)/FAD-dependent oxidoreductase n=1 Tax=Streptosporangium saharense TaxID=1706840 RepID=UPI00343E05C0